MADVMADAEEATRRMQERAQKRLQLQAQVGSQPRWCRVPEGPHLMHAQLQYTMVVLVSPGPGVSSVATLRCLHARRLDRFALRSSCSEG